MKQPKNKVTVHKNVYSVFPYSGYAVDVDDNDCDCISIGIGKSHYLACKAAINRLERLIRDIERSMKRRKSDKRQT